MGIPTPKLPPSLLTLFRCLAALPGSLGWPAIHRLTALIFRGPLENSFELALSIYVRPCLSLTSPSLPLLLHHLLLPSFAQGTLRQVARENIGFWLPNASCLINSRTSAPTGFLSQISLSYPSQFFFPTLPSPQLTLHPSSSLSLLLPSTRPINIVHVRHLDVPSSFPWGHCRGVTWCEVDLTLPLSFLSFYWPFPPSPRPLAF